METTKMTIHRALSELKLIDARINKAIDAIEPTGLMQMNKPVNGFISKEDFEKDVKSKYQSVMDLIDRKNKIKSAIVNANGITKVKIGNDEMTIADAINYKSVIALHKDLISKLHNKSRVVKSQFIRDNEKVNQVALDNAKIMLGKQGDDKVKPTDDDVRNIMEPFIKRNEFQLVDPLKVETLLETLQTKVDAFESEVDAVLSEINSITMIEISH